VKFFSTRIKKHQEHAYTAKFFNSNKKLPTFILQTKKHFNSQNTYSERANPHKKTKQKKRPYSFFANKKYSNPKQTKNQGSMNRLRPLGNCAKKIEFRLANILVVSARRRHKAIKGDARWGVAKIVPRKSFKKIVKNSREKGIFEKFFLLEIRGTF
jgi:hypothetical protein